MGLPTLYLFYIIMSGFIIIYHTVHTIIHKTTILISHRPNYNNSLFGLRGEITFYKPSIIA